MTSSSGTLSGPEIDAAYREYLQRFDAAAGAAPVGGYVKHGGQLVKKLDGAEFAKKWTEFVGADKAYAGVLERGDTISDVLVRVLRERAAELFVDRRY
jgi:hypothetical protein